MIYDVCFLFPAAGEPDEDQGTASDGARGPGSTTGPEGTWPGGGDRAKEGHCSREVSLKTTHSW